MIGTIPDILEELCRIVSSQEKAASRVYLSYLKPKVYDPVSTIAFEPARLFAKTQAQTVFSVTRELRVLIKQIDENEEDPILHQYYPENQPAFDQKLLQLES